MDLDAMIARMELFPDVLRGLTDHLSTQEAQWRPQPKAWSILEIVNHLVDEEVEDFRARLKSTLEDPKATWPAIDPQGWVQQRGYNDADLKNSVARFNRERARSIAWLRRLKEPDWEAAYQHPSLGVIRAGDMMTSWATHDALHLRQIAQRRYQVTLKDAGGFTADYAGPWPSSG